MIIKTYTYYGLLLLPIFILGSCNTISEKKNQVNSEKPWEKIGPGGGGSTFIPTFSYLNPDIFLVRCDMTGSYLTNDGGISYRQINFPGGASSYEFDPGDSSTIYIGSASLNRSVDGGVSWEQIFPAKDEVKQELYEGDHADFSFVTSEGSLYSTESGNITNIRVDPSKNSWIYFNMDSFFFYSNNSGDSWKREDLHETINYIYTNRSSLKDEVDIFTSSSKFTFNKASLEISQTSFPKEMSPAFSISGGTLKNSGTAVFYALHHDVSKQNPYEFVHSEIWISTDNGDSWQPIMDPLITNVKSGTRPSFSMIACSELDAAQAYVVCNCFEEKNPGKSTLYWYGALKTDDTGKSWNWVWKGGGGSGQYGVEDAEDAANLKDAWVHKAFGGEFIQLLDVGVSPQNGNIAIVTDWYRTMKTMDGGKSWNEIYSIENPDTTFTSRGMDVTTTYGVHFDPFDSSHIAISYTDIGFHHSFNGGKSWTRSTEGVPIEWVNTCYWVVFDPCIKNKLWSAWSGLHDFPRGKMTRNPNWKERGRGGVCVSVDGGKTWKPSNEGMGFDSPTTCIVLDPISIPGNRTLYASVYSKGVFKSTDDGKTWQLKNKGIGDNTCAFELTLTDKGVLFLTVSPTPTFRKGENEASYYPGAVYRSDDGAETWTKLEVSEGVLFPNGIEYDRQNPDRIYLACWADIDLSDLVSREVVREMGGNKRLDLKGGIFCSEDGGNTWTSIFDEDQYVYDVTADPYHPGRLYCNTFNRAAWRSDNNGKTWEKIKGYDFHWGHRIIVDQNDPEKIYITTFGSSVWHGIPETE